MTAALDLAIRRARDAFLAAVREAGSVSELDALAALTGRLCDGEVRAELEVRRSELAVAELSAPLEIPVGALLLDEARDAVPVAETRAYAGC